MKDEYRVTERSEAGADLSRRVCDVLDEWYEDHKDSGIATADIPALVLFAEAYRIAIRAEASEAQVADIIDAAKRLARTVQSGGDEVPPPSTRVQADLGACFRLVDSLANVLGDAGVMQMMNVEFGPERADTAYDNVSTAVVQLRAALGELQRRREACP